jgi:type I restriction enzyme M protein
MAAGATVKPSLLFLKKFTHEETEEYKGSVKKTLIEFRQEYIDSVDLFTLFDAAFEVLGDDSRFGKIEDQEKRYAHPFLKEIFDTAEVEVVSKKRINKKLVKELSNKLSEAIRKNYKEDCDYEIPVAQVEKAGITTTGATCENELEGVIHEFQEYFRTNPLWESVSPSHGYDLAGNRAV